MEPKVIGYRVHARNRVRVDFSDGSHYRTTLTEALRASLKATFFRDPRGLKPGSQVWQEPSGVIRTNWTGRAETRGRPPQGKRAMTDAERAAAYRARKRKDATT